VHPTQAFCFIKERPFTRNRAQGSRFEKDNRAAGTLEADDARRGLAGANLGSCMLPEIGRERRWKDEGGCGRGLHVARPQ